MENTLNSFNSLMSTTQKSFYNKKAKLAKTGSSLKSKEGNKISNVITLSKFTDTQSTMTFNPNSRKGMTRSPSCDDVSCRLSLDAN